MILGCTIHKNNTHALRITDNSDNSLTLTANTGYRIIHGICVFQEKLDGRYRARKEKLDGGGVTGEL